MSRLATRITILGLAVVSLSCGEGTGPSDDQTPPVVTGVDPADGATGVSIGASVTVSFSEPVRVSPFPARGLELRSGGIRVFGATVASGTELRFTPRYVLDLGASHTISIGSGVTDRAGNPVAAQSWTFATEGSRPPQLSQGALLADIGALAHDSMAGREAGSAEELAAAEYIRDRFQSLGLEPGVPGYLQTFEIPPDVVGRAGVFSQNVIAVLPGVGDLADQWIVVGAHYDHLGPGEVGPAPPEVYNGADDNASGTALVLDLARVLAEYAAGGGTAGHDRRSFMFHAYGAEELGLIGSQCFCDNPTVPLERVTAMVNFDMVGRLRYEELYLGGLWTSTQWRDELLRYNFDALTLIDFQTCQSCSDHACFRWNNRPSIWFFTGDHPQYHTPADDVALINGPGLVQVGTLALNTLVHLSVRPDEMPFDSPLPAPIAGAEGR